MRVLIVTPYPINKPTNGGQIRAASISEAYRSAGYDVQEIGNCHSYQEQEGYVGNLPLDIMDRHAMGWSLHKVGDMAMGETFYREDEWFDKLANNVRGVPDLIDVEQPWMFRFARRLCLEKFHKSIPIIYSSHNVEFEIRDKMLKDFAPDRDDTEVIKAIKEIEIEAIKYSAGVMCVSEADRKWTAQYTDKEIILAPNGVSAWHSTARARKKVSTMTNEGAFALFCGSWYQPNVTGFFDMLGGPFGSMDAGEYVVIAGSAGTAIKDDVRLLKSAKLGEHLLTPGIIEQEELDALRDMAHAIIIPITQGGGTNLKTAEALWSGHYVIATSVAMRGFEEFRDARGVFIADTPGHFKRILRKVMAMPPLKLSSEEWEQRRIVLWESCLSGLSALAKKTIREG